MKYHPDIDVHDPDTIARYLGPSDVPEYNASAPPEVSEPKPHGKGVKRSAGTMLDYLDRPLTTPEAKRARRQQALAVVMGALPYQSHWSPYFLSFLRCVVCLIFFTSPP